MADPRDEEYILGENITHLAAPHSKGRAVVSVRFDRDHFDLIARCAERLGLRTSTFIRMSAITVAETWGRSYPVWKYDPTSGELVMVTRDPGAFDTGGE